MEHSCANKKETISDLRRELNSAKETKQILEIKMKQQDKTITQLMKEVETALKETYSINFINEGISSDNLRAVIMHMGANGVSSHHMADTIKTILEGLANIKAPKLPCHATICNILQEANLV